MSSGGPDEPDSYVRGGAAPQINTRRVGQVVAVIWLVALLTVAIVLAVEAAGNNSRHSTLRKHGVAVQVTVTKCLGLLTGTGITVDGYTCTGSFVLDGVTHTATIDGTNLDYPIGSALAGVADPANPSDLATAASVGHNQAAWKSYLGAGGVLLGFLVSLGAIGYWMRRRGNPQTV